jgi:phenylpropionate dioxygenase-like ring-hydroxylating dioxygenase large terminal subunit
MASDTNPAAVDLHAEHWGIRRPEGLTHARDLLLSPERMRIEKSRYLSASSQAREAERLWSRVWQVACRAESIPEAGDRIPYTIGDQEIAVVRQPDGSLRAFYNACLHRGGLLVRGAGNADQLRCPYHGWCWHLDGRLAEIPDRYLTSSIDDEEYGLREVACDTWAGYVFVNLAGRDAPPLLDFLGLLPERLEAFQMEAQRLMSWQTLELPCNWKVLTEAFLETYHVPGIHPKLVTLLDESNVGYERLGLHHRMWIPYGLPSLRHRDTSERDVFESWLREHFRERHLDWSGRPDAPDEATWEPSFTPDGDIEGPTNSRSYILERQRAEGRLRGHDYSGLAEHQLIDVDHYLFFPNFVILAKADDTFIIRSRPEGRDPERCLVDVMRLQPRGHGEADSPAAEQQWIEASEQDVLATIGEVIWQDFHNVAGVQRGLRARELEHVTLTANDIRIRWLHDDIDALLDADVPS